jgi:alpha-1,2-mannosyltransferase
MILLDFVMDCVIALSAVVFVAVFVLRARRQRGVTGFFHPYCNDGGGGERVLWCAVQALLNQEGDIKVAVFTGDKESKAAILSKARERFSIDLQGNSTRIKFVRLRCRSLLEPSKYPVFTLLGQSIGGLLLAIEALLRLTPEVFLDTMGSAPTYVVARYLMGCRVGCYVHYPTISSDMLDLVEQRKTSFNNRAVISKSLLLSRAKLIYYRFLAAAYGVAGRASHATMVNSSWTQRHISEIWGETPIPHVVFPPCNTVNLQSIPLGEREQLIISLGQFRPEKNHSLQLRAIACFREAFPTACARLVIIGSCRNAGDESRVAALNQVYPRRDCTCRQACSRVLPCVCVCRPNAHTVPTS